MSKKAALLIVDVQNDFCPSGALQVPQGDRVVEPVNRAAGWFYANNLPILATRDWHPNVTKHFREFGGAWPVHCIQGSPGAEFHPDLRLPPNTMVISKGEDPLQDGYSAFEATDDTGRSLQTLLLEHEVRHLYVAGLATDYCVLITAREALNYGYLVTVLTDAVAGVDVLPGDSQRALKELSAAGARMATVAELLQSAATAA